MIKNSLRQKGSTHVVIIIILVFVLLGALGFIFWQNFINKEPSQSNPESNTSTNTPVEIKDSYEGWKSYESNRDEYSIKYPSNWFLTTETEGDGPYIRNFDPNNSSDGPRDGQYSGYPLGAKYLRVLVDKNENGKKNASDMSTGDWYDALGTKNTQDMGAVKHLASEVKAVNINGIEAKSAKAAFTETNEVIYLMNGTDLYSIWLYPYGSSDDEEMKLIINSFKFL